MKHIVFIVIITFCVTHLLSAQLCTGNLGENIFEDGSFGSGSDNVLAVDPGIAPGYSYTTNPPPNDGSYTLSNNVAPWDQWGWVKIGDNSTDPEGYMMIVNASFEPGLFYEKLIEGLCENTLYEFSADIHNLHFGPNIIKPNVSFLLDDVVQFSTGNIPENNQWNSYGFTFTTDPGQTAVKLSLANNAPGGIGNDLAIDNISFRACGPEALILPETIADICEDGSPISLDATVNGDQFPNPAVQWQESFDEGITWMDLPGETNLSYIFTNLAAGRYYFRYKLASNANNLSNPFCQVISNTKIVDVIPTFTDFTDSICEGLSLQVGQSIYTETGLSVDTLQNRLGCDSIVTFDLTVFQDPSITPDFAITETTCSYSEDGAFTLNSIDNGIPPYTLFFNGLEAQNMISNLASGTYPLLIIDDVGCTHESEIIITSPNEYTLSLGEDIEVNLGEEITIEINSNGTTSQINFNSPYEIECLDSDCTEFNITPFQNGQVGIQGISELNCIAEDSIQIKVNRIIDVYQPTIFSPNGDNLNDNFGLYINNKIFKSLSKFSIYDRWGNRVYHIENIDSNITNLWDGTFNGQQVLQGVYSYIAEIELIDSSIEIISGSVTLLR